LTTLSWVAIIIIIIICGPSAQAERVQNEGRSTPSGGTLQELRQFPEHRRGAAGSWIADNTNARIGEETRGNGVWTVEGQRTGLISERPTSRVVG
jgi:hypothetical protein